MLKPLAVSYMDAVDLINRKRYEPALCALHIICTSDQVPLKAKADSWATAGTLYASIGKPEQAHQAYLMALALNPRCVEALHNMATVAVAAHRGAEAALLFESVLHQRPDMTNSIAGLVGALVEQGRFADAVFPARRALQQEPENAAAHWNLCLALLGSGDFANGWTEHEWRRNLNGWPARNVLPTTPEWKGEDLSGKRLLVLAEQGLGDMIMWLRWMPEFAARGATVIAEAHDPLVPIFRWMPGIDEITSFGDSLPPHDLHTYLGSAAWRLGIPRQSVVGAPYLTVPAYLFEDDPRPTVGIAWRGRPSHGNDHNRSMSDRIVGAIASYPGIRWVSLQFDAPPPVTMLDMRDHIRSMADTAAIMRGCDLVVSVDSAPAHLAGALGVPVWILLPNPCEWRWSLGDDSGERTPWYQSATLIRQHVPGDWDGVVDKVHERLGEILKCS